MTLDAWLSSVGLALITLSLLGWKWRLQMTMVVPGALLIGALSAIVVSAIETTTVDLRLWAMMLIELLLIVLVTFACIVLRFYRDPKRVPLETGNVILSPADGKIIYVNSMREEVSLVSTKGDRSFELKEITATDLLTDAAYMVGIDMNVFDVHVNRAPIAGKIILQKRVNGRFVSLRRTDAEVLNERVTTVIDNGRFRVAMVQIASRLVRRIVSFRNEGDSVSIGQRIGMIKFGSQVDVVIPRLKSLEVIGTPGDRVKAGVSVIARYGQ